MIMPILSVTSIGVTIGLLTALFGRRSSTSVVVAVAAAWIGFLGGAVVGVTIDILAGSGTWLAVLGHTAAAAGAVVAVTRQHARAG